jgi:hypothetical protein
MEQGLVDLPKHTKYSNSYKRFDYYWGLGVEHELYLKTSQTRDITTFAGCRKPERYSVNYYTVYDPIALEETLQLVLQRHGGKVSIPILVNGQTYEKVPKPNPQYSGITFFEWACNYSKWLKTQFDKCYMWDGDTVEFMTQNFYKATVGSVINELQTIATRFEKEIASLPRQGFLVAYAPLKLAAPINEPWAIHLTNLRNIAMFNNGTLHINLTLPTRLGWNRKPLLFKTFVKRHQVLARIIQWLEPFWVALYGSGDPLSAYSDRYAKGSQRVAVSRYIGLGTFDTEHMPRGKILQVPRGDIPWYDELYKVTDYLALEKIGLDINFNKHGAHGLELRFFDQMPYSSLKTVMEQLVLLMDVSLQYTEFPNPTKNPEWQKAATAGMLHGKEWIVSPEFSTTVCSVFSTGIQSSKEPVAAADLFQQLFSGLERYRGRCWNLMVEGGRPPGCLG